MATRQRESVRDRVLREAAAGGDELRAMLEMVMDGGIDEAIVRLGMDEIRRAFGNACVARQRDGLSYRETLEVGDKVRLVNVSPKYLTHNDATVTAIGAAEITIEFGEYADLGRYSRTMRAKPSQLRKIA